MRKMLLTMIGCGLATAAFCAARYTWQGGAETRYWSEPGMWKNDSTGEIGDPVAEDEVRIWGTGTTVITNGDAVTTTTASLRYGQTLLMQGGTWNNLGAGDNFFIPWSNKGATTGTLIVEDGTLDVAGNLQISFTTATSGFLRHYGGNIVVRQYAVVGHALQTTGSARHLGGTMSVPRASRGYVVGEYGVGSLEIGGTANVSIGGALGVWFYNRTEGASGSVSLGTGGTLTTGLFTVGDVNGYLGDGSTFSFDGGTLRTSQDREAFVTVGGADTPSTLTALGVTSRGGVVDTDGHAVTFNQALTAADAVAPSNLVHRWSFNGDLVDSIGGTAATTSGTVNIGAGSFSLPGGAQGAGAVDLGSGLIPTGEAGFTIEIWARQDAVRKWSRVFDVGTEAANALLLAWTTSSTLEAATVSVFYDGVQRINKNVLGGFPLGTFYHIAVTATPDGAGGWLLTGHKLAAGTGAALASFSIVPNAGWSPANQADGSFWLGRSLSGDMDAAATYDEVRIWNRPLTEWELVMNDLAGPDAVIGESPFVKTGAGTLTLTGANTYVVPTEVEAGTLALASGASLASDVLVKTGGVFAVAADATPPAVAIEVGEGGACGCVTSVAGALDLGRLSLRVANPEALSNARPYVICRAADGFSGTLPAAGLPQGWQAVVDSAHGEVRLVKSGMAVVIR